MARPSTPKLSSELIAAAALKLVDKNGEFTIPQLAKALSVSASSLYNHVGGKDEIIELMRGQAMSRVQLPEAPGGHWRETLRLIAVSYFESYSRHPPLIPPFTSHTVRGRTPLRVFYALAPTLAGAGFDPAARLTAITIIDSFVLGSALDAAAPDEVWATDVDSSASFTEALEEGLGSAERAEQTFGQGLDIILAGLKARVSARG